MRAEAIRIHRLGPGDAGLMARVADDVFDDEIVPARLAAMVANPDVALVVAMAVDDQGEFVVGQIAGCIIHHPDGDSELFLENLGIAAAWRRRGIATRLIAALAEFGKARGAGSMWVGVEPLNQTALALYRSVGLLADPAVICSAPMSAILPAESRRRRRA